MKVQCMITFLLVKSVLIQCFLSFLALIIPRDKQNSGKTRTQFSFMYQSLFPGQSYSTYSIKRMSSIWALVLSATVRTTWGGVFGHWSYSRKSKGVGEGGMGHIPSGVGVWIFFLNQLGRRVCMWTGAFLKNPKG